MLKLPEGKPIPDGELRLEYQMLNRTGQLRRAKAILLACHYYKEKVTALEEKQESITKELENRGRLLAKQSAELQDLRQKLKELTNECDNLRQRQTDSSKSEA